jgi:hypothetical protein
MIKRILLILLLPGLLSASTLKRLDSLYLMALMEAGVDSITNQNSLVAAKRAVNAAVQQVSADFPAVRKSDSAICSDGVASYAITDTTFRAGSLTWCRIWRQHPPDGTQNLAVLKVIPADSVYEYVQQGKALAEDLAPIAYVYCWAGSLHVAPVPNYGDTLKYGYLAIGSFLSGAAGTTDILPKYRHLIVLYAAYLIKKDLNQDYTLLLAEYEAALQKRTRR